MVDWFNGRSNLQVLILEECQQKIRPIHESYLELEISHTYRNFNMVDDSLSKEAMDMDVGSLCVKHFKHEVLLLEENYHIYSVVVAHFQLVFLDGCYIWFGCCEILLLSTYEGYIVILKKNSFVWTLFIVRILVSIIVEVVLLTLVFLGLDLSWYSNYMYFDSNGITSACFFSSWKKNVHGKSFLIIWYTKFLTKLAYEILRISNANKI